MVKICPKLDKGKLEDSELLSKLKAEGFSSFELHTTEKSNWSELSDIISHSGLRVEVVHAPNKLKNSNDLNLCVDNDNAKISADVLYEVVQFAKGVQSKKVVFHIWAIPYFQNGRFIEDIEEARKKGRENLVKYMLQIINPEVKLLPEISPLIFFREDFLPLCPPLCNLNDFKEIINSISEEKSNPNVGLTADIDHIYQVAILQETIYPSFISAFRSGKPTKEILDEIVCKPMLNYCITNTQEVNKKVSDIMIDIFTGLKDLNYPIPHIHTSGIAHPQNSLIRPSLLVSSGEHIPVGYKGPTTKGGVKGNVEDVMDHKLYLKHVKGTDAAIVLEFDTRSDYDFFEQVVNSRKHLEKVLAEI